MMEIGLLVRILRWVCPVRAPSMDSSSDDSWVYDRE